MRPYGQRPRVPLWSAGSCCCQGAAFGNRAGLGLSRQHVGRVVQRRDVQTGRVPFELPGLVGLGHALRDQQGREHNARDDVLEQPLAAVGRDHLKAGHRTEHGHPRPWSYTVMALSPAGQAGASPGQDEDPRAGAEDPGGMTPHQEARRQPAEVTFRVPYNHA
jgi:hypothetical protein